MTDIIVPARPARPIVVEGNVAPDITIQAERRLPPGGTTGQALIKASDSDFATVWGTATAAAAWGAITGTLSSQTDLQAALDAKQATLVSGVNIKTLNGSTILGSGDLVISASATWGGITGTLSSQTDLVTDLNSRDTANRNRANHTGTQAASTITGLAAVATSGSATDLSAGTLPAARFDDTAHGSRSGGTLHANATTAVAGFMSSADKTKLDGVATGATANATDAALRDRSTHTGTQASTTISDFNAAVVAAAWGRAGNSGTNSATEFIGTTDNVPMVFRSNNLRRMVIGSNGNVGINLSTLSPGQLLHLGDGNILLEGGGETAMLFKLGATIDGVPTSGPTHPNAPFVNPIFQIGRVIEGGDGAPQFRWMYSDDGKAERVVFELDSEGILSSVRQTGVRGSHFEAHRSGDTHPLFRLNSFPHMQLQMGNGGTDDTDIAIGRTAAQKGALQYGPPTAQVTAAEWSSAGLKIAVGGLTFPDNSVQTTAATGGGGSSLSGAATLTLSTDRYEHEETVTATGVTGTSKVSVWLAPTTDGDENSPDMTDLITLSATPGTNQITVLASFREQTSGPLKIQWSAF